MHPQYRYSFAAFTVTPLTRVMNSSELINRSITIKHKLNQSFVSYITVITVQQKQILVLQVYHFGYFDHTVATLLDEVYPTKALR
jgi:hypothetical protein